MSQVIPTFAIHFHLDMAIVDSKLCVTVQLAASVYDNKDKQLALPWQVCWKFMYTWCSMASMSILPMPHGYGPLCKNMALSTKPEGQNVLHCYQRRTGNRHTGTLTAIFCTPTRAGSGKVKM